MDDKKILKISIETVEKYRKYIDEMSKGERQEIADSMKLFLAYILTCIEKGISADNMLKGVTIMMDGIKQFELEALREKVLGE